MNLRAQAEADLSTSLEDPALFGQAIDLISPDGELQTVYGQVLYDSTVTDEMGIQTIVHKPVVTVRRSSLTRVPLPTDRPRWGCRIPETPRVGSDKVTFIVENPHEGGGSIGFMRFYLTRATQAVES